MKHLTLEDFKDIEKHKNANYPPAGIGINLYYLF